VAKRTVGDEWDGNGDIKEREAVEEEVARVGRTVNKTVSIRFECRRKELDRGVLRWCESVEGKKESNEPEDRVSNLDREFGRCEKQREQTDVACYGERSEGAEVPAVV
jgi:hypothetical protein